LSPISILRSDYHGTLTPFAIYTFSFVRHIAFERSATVCAHELQISFQDPHKSSFDEVAALDSE
jgi:hypothetical protein